jgi:hypothetical protein
LPRHRTIQCSRSKAVALIAVGAFSVATAASAAAATWTGGPPGSPAGRPHDAGAIAPPAVADQVPQPPALPQVAAGLALWAGQISGTEADLSFAPWKTAQERVAGQAARKAAPVRGQSGPSSQSARPVTVTVAPSGSPQQIAEAMLGSFGWSSSQFSCLDPLWAHESGWSVSAFNAGSGAYGIPQAVPGSRMASAGPDWQTDAVTQIRWGLEYIRDTYGSPCGAWDHEEATGWY